MLVRDSRVLRFLLVNYSSNIQRCLVAIILALGCAGIPSAARAEIAASPSAPLPGLDFVGSGTLRHAGLLKIYDASFYADLNASSFQSAAKSLEVHYNIGIKASRQNNIGRKLLGQNVSADTLRALEDELSALETLFPDFARGDRCRLDHVPGRGLSLWRNSELLGSVPSDRLAEAYFLIWFGASPAGKSLKQKLSTHMPPTWNPAEDLP